MRYLSAEWLGAMDEAASASDALRRRSAGLRLVVQQTVTDEVEGDITYHLVLDDGEVALRPGPTAEPTLELMTDRATATSIARGERSVQSALVSGDLVVRGEVVALVDHQALFTCLDGVFAGVTSRIEW